MDRTVQVQAVWAIVNKALILIVEAIAIAVTVGPIIYMAYIVANALQTF